jgi:hypothetical protein
MYNEHVLRLRFSCRIYSGLILPDRVGLIMQTIYTIYTTILDWCSNYQIAAVNLCVKKYCALFRQHLIRSGHVV